MAGSSSIPFGKRTPQASPPQRKRSDSARLKLMAGAGAAALGVYALAPGSSCPTGRFYRSVDECIGDGRLGEALCRSGFDRQSAAGIPAGVMFSGPDWGTSRALFTSSDGTLKTLDGQRIDPNQSCRSRSSSSSSSRRSWWSSSSSSSSGSSSSYGSSSSDSGHATSRGGFGLFGHGFSVGS